MNESEWLASDDQAALLRHLTHETRIHEGGTSARPRAVQPSDRKLRLWVCACVRSEGPLSGKDARDVPRIERLADAGASEAQYRELDGLLLGTGADWARRWAARKMAGGPDLRAPLLRDIFGNPFRPAPSESCTECAGGVVPTGRDDDTCPCCHGTGRRFPRRWVTAAARRLARGVYEDRDFAALPVLADALDEAGCEDEDMLGHLRGPGPHALGCWAVDLVLGKE